MLKERVDEFEEKLNIYNKKLEKRKERWHYIYINGEKTKYAISNYGKLFDTKTGKITEASHYNKNNEIIDYYTRVVIKHKGKKERFQLHRLVAFYFCKIPKRLREQGLSYDDLVVNHKNGIKTCNASFNLEWVTQYENMEHAFKTKLCIGIFGENSHLSKITEKQVIEICELIIQRKTNSEISEQTGVTKKTIQHIRSKEDWKEITEKYDFPKLSDIKPYTMDEKKLHEVCRLLEYHKYSDKEISNITGIDRRYIADIRLGKRRKDISSQYNINPVPVIPITEEQIKLACKLLEEKSLSQAKIAKQCGICQCLVSEIFNHKKYTDISKNYNF